jgi:hypothetical protein
MIKMIQRLERLKVTVDKYMADIRPDRLTTCQSERKSVVSRLPSVFCSKCPVLFHRQTSIIVTSCVQCSRITGVDKSPRLPLRTETDAVPETFRSFRNTSWCSVSRNPVLTRWMPLHFLLTKNTVNRTAYEDSIHRTGIPCLTVLFCI